MFFRVTLAAVACCLLVSATCALAESWVVAYSNPNGGAVDIDTDSIQVTGNLLRYRNRFARYGGGYVEAMVAANCQEQTRGDWTDLRMYPVYPDTRNGIEVEAVCSHAVRMGLLSVDLAAAKPKPLPAVAPATDAAVEPRKRVSSSGSGFFVGPRSVVTNFHVVDGCTKFKVRRDMAAYPARLVASASRSDLALLELETIVGTVPPIRAGAALGEDVMIAGHPLSGLLAADLIVTSGQVNSLAGLGNDPTFLQISAPVQPGNSGGPVIDRSGAIVGVVVSKVDVERLAKLTGDIAQNVNFAIKPEVLRMFLDANRISYRSSSLGKRVESVDLAERARAFTVQIICSD